MVFEIQMQICVSREEFSQKRTPYFLHFPGVPPLHVKIQSYRYPRDCILEVSFFHHTSVFSANMNAPAVCFHPDDTGGFDSDAQDSLCRMYTHKFKRSAAIRDELDTLFPNIKIQAVGLVCDEIIIVARLAKRLVLAIPSSADSRPFLWDWKNVQTKRGGEGFEVIFPSAKGMKVYWYRVLSEPMCFADAQAIAQFAGDRRRVDQYVATDALVAGSDIIRAQVCQLRTVYPDLRVASFSPSPDSVVVRIDRQWLCTVVLRRDGTWTVNAAEPDPIIALKESASYIDQMRANVETFLSTCTHFFRTGRICANCSTMVSRKMRRCPCKGAYYCGRECQKAHWAVHKPGCGALTSE
jgi:hypothetical protein